MKSFRMRSLVGVTALMCLLLVASPISSAEPFSVKEYDRFHDVLRPLQHEALPNKDFQRIRSNAAELIKLGKAIVKVGVPSGIAKTNVEKFRLELTKFKKALNKFSQEAKAGSDSRLETSFSAVHDSFELLAEMLPRK